jgi:Fuc2NAc and GlcNAc transferase
VNAALLLFAVTFIVALCGTWLLRHYAIARSVLDVPNDRSSHTRPTPRGGGVAIVVAFLAGVLTLTGFHLLDARVATALVGAGALIALVGFLDDHRHIPARWRLLAHFGAASWVLVWLGGLPRISALGVSFDLGWTGNVLAAVALVWLLNLYNFMDGIDGIAGVEAITVCVGAVALYLTSSAPSSDWALPAVLAAAALGFLVWNFPPAKIFMGDAGSGFLGLMLGALAIHGATFNAAWLWSWIILLGVFVVDATVTLVRRLVRRERVHQAHRSHAYQHAALRAGAHRPVTLAVGAVNLFWLVPLALLVGTGRLDGLVGTAIAYAPLIWLTRRFDAGAAEDRARDRRSA